MDWEDEYDFDLMVWNEDDDDYDFAHGNDATAVAKKEVDNWNASYKVGEKVDFTIDHGKEWTRAKLASRAFLRNGEPMVRVQGHATPLRLVDVAPIKLP